MDIKQRYKNFSEKYPRGKKIIGIVLIVIGLLALITPLTPGAWLIFVGLEFIGIRLAWWTKIKQWLQRQNKNQ